MSVEDDIRARLSERVTRVLAGGNRDDSGAGPCKTQSAGAAKPTASTRHECCLSGQAQ
jgi:hypothetical protein